MARPRRNNAEYFQHYTGLRNHRKVKMLRNKFGSVLGYAFWCMMLEWLTEHDGLEWEFSELEIEMFASELGVSDAEIPPMVNYCLKIELIFKNNDGFIYSESLNDYLNPVFEKRNKEREKSKSRQRKSDGTFIPVQQSTIGGVSAADSPHSRVEESRVEESNVSKLTLFGTAEPTQTPVVPEKKIATYDEKKVLFIDLFNKTADRQFKILNEKADRQFKKLINKGITAKQFKIAIINAKKILKQTDKLEYLSPEYITRDDKFDFYFNHNPKVLDEAPKSKLNV